MQTHGNNALHIKRKISADYRQDANCTILHPTTGKRLELPAFLIVALRNGEVKLKND